MSASPETVLAVDIGGTKIAAGVVDADGRLLRWATEPTPTGPDPEAIWQALTTAVTRAEPDGAQAIGIGSAGPMERGGVTVSPLNILGWQDFPLLQRVS